VHRLIKQGEKMEAIKLIRDRTGLGLKEANDIADQLG
jgi:ribosomal protein L7/L12